MLEVLSWSEFEQFIRTTFHSLGGKSKYDCNNWASHAFDVNEGLYLE